IQLAAFAPKSAKICSMGAQPILVDKPLASGMEVRGDVELVNEVELRSRTRIGCGFSQGLPGNADPPILGPNSS
ncbi:MAG: hypothetical protein ACRD1B_05205, partial [Thermoanaerobaculia bacterium]